MAEISANEITEIDQRILKILGESPGIHVRRDLSGRDISTLCVGGPVRALADVDSIEALMCLRSVFTEFKLESRIVGNGSNILVNDQGLSEWLVRLGGDFRRSEQIGITKDGSASWTCGAGTSLMALSREVSSLGLSGLGFAGGIPATLGGALRMNAGAHGSEISEVVEWVDVLSPAGVIERRDRGALQFAYRWSSLDAHDFVVAVGLKLKETSVAKASEERAHCLEERRARQPLTQPSAGSIFKNPSTSQSAGWLIENCGLKGFRIGEVEISQKHANWIVNPTKRGLASDVARLIAHCQEVVERQHGVLLKPEVLFFS